MRCIFWPLAGALLLAGCAADETPATDTAAVIDTGVVGAAPGAGAVTPGATAVMRDAAGNEIGTLALADAGEGIAVSGTLRGLEPGVHAIHIHTTGQCEPSFEAAGGHWNPTNQDHGTLNPQGPHLGDMPNIEVGTDSTVTVNLSTPGGSLRGTNAALDADGAAVMVHAGPDDYRTEPAGASGERVACGVITGG